MTEKLLNEDAVIAIKQYTDKKINSVPKYEAFKGATSAADGTEGLVKKPVAGEQNKFLKADGTWSDVPDPQTFTGATSTTDGTEGLVKKPLAGDQNKVLKGNGNWETLPEQISIIAGSGVNVTSSGTNTTISTRIDNNTIKYDTNGVMYSESAAEPLLREEIDDVLNNYYNIWCNANPNAGGTLTPTQDIITERTFVKLTVSPNTGYTFVDYTTSPAISISSGGFLMPASDVSITANFEMTTPQGTYWKYDPNYHTLYLRGGYSEGYTNYNGKGRIGNDESAQHALYVVTDKYTKLPPNCASMFEGYSSVVSIDFSNIKQESNITTTARMFFGCKKLQNIVNIKNLKLGVYGTTSSVNSMFSQCTSLTSVDITDWDLLNTTSFSYMFNNCKNLSHIYVSPTWDVATFSDDMDMFANCYKLKNYNPNYVKSQRAVLDDGDSNGYLQVLATGTYYKYYESLNSLTLRGVPKEGFSQYTGGARIVSETQARACQSVTCDHNIILPENCNYMFDNFVTLTSINVCAMDTSNVSSTRNMFNSCQDLQHIYADEDWDISKLTYSNTTSMFTGCTDLHNFNSAYTDKTKAIIDDGSNGGYLERKAH